MDEKKRIIGDFLEINADNIQYREEHKNNPIAKVIYKNNHRKLVKTVNKLRKTGLILTRDNLIELFSYVYNNFPPYGNYKSIYRSKINTEEPEEVEAIIKFDNYTIIITTIKKLETFDIVISEKMKDDETNSYNLTLKSLNYKPVQITKIDLKIIIDNINKRLLEEMCDYILSVLNLYK